VPPVVLNETMKMEEKLQDLGRDLAATLSPSFAGDAEAVKRNIATSAAMAAFGAGMAGHAFGVWLSAVSSSLEVAQRFSSLATGGVLPVVPSADATPGEARDSAAPATVGRSEAGIAAPRAIDRPDAPDVLKAIGGIGPKLEKVLNGLGIWTYAQIAALTEGEVAWLDEQLGFRGRIERDEWLKQATALDAASA
jgi:NADH-quinone oxidoreductase subunit E